MYENAVRERKVRSNGREKHEEDININKFAGISIKWDKNPFSETSVGENSRCC